MNVATECLSIQEQCSGLVPDRRAECHLLNVRIRNIGHGEEVFEYALLTGPNVLAILANK